MIRDGIVRAGVCETLEAQNTGVAVAARDAIAVGVVAGARQRVIDSEVEAELNDLRLRKADQRGVDGQLLLGLDCSARGEIRHRLKRADVLRPAIGIAGVINRVDTKENVLRAKYFRPCNGEGKKDRVAGR